MTTMTLEPERVRELEALAEESRPVADRAAICIEDETAGTWRDLVTGTEAAGLHQLHVVRFNLEPSSSKDDGED